jgi:hypothetical protein
MLSCRHFKFSQGLFNQVILVVVFDNQVNTKIVFNGIGIQTGMTAGNDEPGVWIVSMQATDLLSRFSICLGGHRAGVKHHDIGFCTIGGDLMPLFQELTGPGFQFGLIQATPQGLEINVQVLLLNKDIIPAKKRSRIIATSGLKKQGSRSIEDQT